MTVTHNPLLAELVTYYVALRGLCLVPGETRSVYVLRASIRTEMQKLWPTFATDVATRDITRACAACHEYDRFAPNRYTPFYYPSFVWYALPWLHSHFQTIVSPSVGRYTYVLAGIRHTICASLALLPSDLLAVPVYLR